MSELHLTDISSFQDLITKLDGRAFLFYRGGIQPSFCLAYDHKLFFTFAADYSEAQLNRDIADNMERFSACPTTEFYCPNTNMFSHSNAVSGLKGDVMHVKTSSEEQSINEMPLRNL